MINDDNLILAMAALAAVIAVYVFYQKDEAQSSLSDTDFLQGISDSLTETTGTVLGAIGLNNLAWRKLLDTKGAPYKAALAAAEKSNGIPTDMLARLAYQESRYNPNAFNAGSGATGLMQIVPRWHPNVNAKDPFASIAYAGKFLASLKKQLGTWELALKGYNWGAANVQKWQAGKINEPTETRLYSAQILSDIGLA